MKFLSCLTVLMLSIVLFSSGGPPGGNHDVKQKIELSSIISDEVLTAVAENDAYVFSQVYESTIVVEAEPIILPGDELSAESHSDNIEKNLVNDAEIFEPVYLRGDSPPGRWRQGAFTDYKDKLSSGYNSQLRNPPPGIVFRT